MSEAAARPPTPRAEATLSAIVETADRLFRTHGYQRTTVADIARELRMSPANLYRFFASKSAINEAVCARVLAGLEAQAWAVARTESPAEDRMRRLFVLMQQQTIALFFHEKRMHDMVAAALEEHWGVIDSYLVQLDKALRHIIMDGQAEGRFAKLDAELSAQLVHASMISFCHPRVVQECHVPDDLPAQAAAMAEFALRALRRNPTTDEY